FFSLSDSAHTKQSIHHKNPTTKKSTKNKQRTGKSKQRSRTSENEDPELYIPPEMILDTLVTWNSKKKKYVPILNKN
ncbi:25208_t:CDS:1, partial [Cetraspora pellucida]